MSDNIQEAKVGSGTAVANKDAEKRAQLTLKSIKLRIKQQKERESLASQKNAVKTEETVMESFSPSQIAALKAEYSKINTVDPDSDTYKKLIAMLDRLDLKSLKSLAGAEIKFVSKLAQNRVLRKSMKKEDVQLDEISTKLLAKAAHAASDPDSDYHYGKSHDPQKFADRAKKTKDAKSAAAVQGAADAKGHYTRPGHTIGSYDKLAHRSPARVTSAGKANKQDVNKLKSNIKRNEEVEPIDEQHSVLYKMKKSDPKIAVAHYKSKDDADKFLASVKEKGGNGVVRVGKIGLDLTSTNKKINELSNEKLADYKKKAGENASAADKAGDTKTGNKRFSGIMKATRKQFANDDKKTNEDVTEASQRVDSLVTDALKIMKGSELKDAVQALKTVLGDREYNDRRGHYNFYVKQLVDMYGKKTNEELSPKQKDIDKNKNGKIDGTDLAHLRDKKKPQGADFAAQRRKERMASNGRMDEAKSDYEVYHKDYSGAVQTAIKQAEKRGYEVDMDDWHDKVATGPKKPSAGKTNSFSVKLKKDGKESKKALHLQVYNMDNHKYELNMYIEEIQLDELNKDTLHSYVNKSEKDQDKQYDKIGRGIRDNNPKSANKAGHKFSMRSIGQNRAEKRLAKEGVVDKIKAIKRGVEAKAKADDHFDKAGDPKNANASKDLKKAVRYHNLLNKEEVVLEAKKPKSFKDVKKKMKEEEKPNKATIEKGDDLTGKKEPIEINPEIKESKNDE